MKHVSLLKDDLFHTFEVDKCVGFFLRPIRTLNQIVARSDIQQMIHEWNNNTATCTSKLIDNKDNLVGYFIYVMNNLKRDL